MRYDPQRFLLIAGPCLLESREVSIQVADALRVLGDRHPELQIVFKGSFDKANRTSLNSARGPGMDEGLDILRMVGSRTGFPTTTDVHETHQAATVAQVCEVLQIPAFLCRQTDLLLACGATRKIVNVKKGQFLAPEDMEFAVRKAGSGGAAEVWQTERGTTFGYRDLVVDMRSFCLMAQFARPTIFDASHSVQRPGGAGGSSGGARHFIPSLAEAALAAGADGLFLETHPDPAKALSDSQTQWPLGDLPRLVERLLRVWKALRS